MKRRGFLIRLLTAGALATGATRRAAQARYTQALRARRYPGPLRTIDPRDLMRPGKWAG